MGEVIQGLIARNYSPAYERAWVEYSAGHIDVDTAIERTHWVRVSARIKRETGYEV